MTWLRRTLAGVLLTITASVPATLQADTVQLTVGDGRVSLVATDATPAQIFEVWSREGGVLIVNAERMPGVPLTLTLDNVPEEQALDTLLRPVSGYLARRRPTAADSGSIFDRIVILATPFVARETTAASAPSSGPARQRLPTPVFPQPRTVGAQPAPTAPANGAPPVGRIIGADGQPVEDDQAVATPPPFVPPPQYNGGNGPDGRPPVAPPRGVTAPMPQQPPPQQQPAQPSTSAPVGVPRPGMPVPAPPPAQPR